MPSSPPEALALDDVTYRELRAHRCASRRNSGTRVCGLGIGSRSTPKTGRASCTRTSAACGRRDRSCRSIALPHRRPRACAPKMPNPPSCACREQSAPFAAELPGRRLVAISGRGAVGPRRCDRRARGPASAAGGRRRDPHLHERNDGTFERRRTQPSQPSARSRPTGGSVALDRRRHPAADATAVSRPRPRCGLEPARSLPARARCCASVSTPRPWWPSWTRATRRCSSVADDVVRILEQAGPSVRSSMCGCSCRGRPRCRQRCTKNSPGASASRSSSATVRPNSVLR